MNSASWWAAVPRRATRSSILLLCVGLLGGSFIQQAGAQAYLPASLSLLLDDEGPNNGGDVRLAGLTASGQIYYTANLTTWTQIPGGLVQLQIGDLNGDGQGDLAGLAGNGSIWYTTNRNNWTNIPGQLNRLAGSD